MVKAYLLIIARSGTERDTVEALLKKENVDDAHLIYGEYDIIVKANVDDVSQLNDFILEEIRTLGTIERTSTLIIAD